MSNERAEKSFVLLASLADAEEENRQRKETLERKVFMRFHSRKRVGSGAGGKS